jgi:Zn-dependent protease
MKAQVGLWALLIKIGPKIASTGIKLLKSLKVGKAGLAGASFASYAYMFTWEFAFIIMSALFLHECGHIWAMKRCGIKTKGIYFIPFVGGAAVSEEMCHSRSEEVFIALMGPIWGLLLAIATGFLYYIYEEPIFAAAASWMAMLNLLNLLPISPLDGGRVIKSIGFSIQSTLGFCILIAGLLITGFLIYKTGMGLFVFLLAIGIVDLIFEYSRRTVSFPEMNFGGILYSFGAYLVLIGFLWYIMEFTKHIPGAAAAMELLKS